MLNVLNITIKIILTLLLIAVVALFVWGTIDPGGALKFIKKEGNFVKQAEEESREGREAANRISTDVRKIAPGIELPKSVKVRKDSIKTKEAK